MKQNVFDKSRQSRILLCQELMMLEVKTPN